MNKRIKATVTREREVNMFAELSHGHSVLLDNAKQKRDGYLYEAMSCLVIAAFKSEAFLNDNRHKDVCPLGAYRPNPLQEQIA